MSICALGSLTSDSAETTLTFWLWTSGLELCQQTLMMIHSLNIRYQRLTFLLADSESNEPKKGIEYHRQCPLTKFQSASSLTKNQRRFLANQLVCGQALIPITGWQKFFSLVEIPESKLQHAPITKKSINLFVMHFMTQKFFSF